MALKENFYEEIYEEERNWSDMIDMNLLNVYYLVELKKFYYDRQVRLNYEYELTFNPIIKSMLYLLNNVLIKIDYIINEDKLNNPINIKELKNYFLINQLNNNISYVAYEEIPIDKGIYNLRQKCVNEDLDDYIDDDFYYENQKVA